ncbi:MAG: hypothetical protein QNJ69_08995 [Gammaproteobacteria bacterium]|nr:hypothetical protein [Gammaproteobacteria bacterium]
MMLGPLSSAIKTSVYAITFSIKIVINTITFSIPVVFHPITTVGQGHA